MLRDVPELGGSLRREKRQKLRNIIRRGKQVKKEAQWIRIKERLSCFQNYNSQ